MIQEQISQKMIETKYAEIRDLFNRSTFRTVLRIELPDGAYLITARCVLAIKLDEDKEERYKEKYVAGGHYYIMKDYLVYGTQKIQFLSIRIILVIANTKAFCIWVVDVKLAYVQSDKHLIRKILIKNPAPELELPLKSSWNCLNQSMA